MAGTPAPARPAAIHTVPPDAPPADADELIALLDLALHATAATVVALLVPDGSQLRVLQARGADAPAPQERISLEGTVAGEAWYRARLVIGPEAPPRGRQAALWQDERTVDVMAMPVTLGGRPAGVMVLYHGHLGHFRRTDATCLGRLATIAAGLWGAPAVGPRAEPRSVREVGAGTTGAGGVPRESERDGRLFSEATDALFTLDRRGVITSFNEAAERLWSVRARTVLGTRWDTALPFESPAVVAEQIARAMTGDSCTFEVWLHRPDAERSGVMMSISPLVEEGRATAVLCIVRDVSDQRRVQSQVLQAEKMSAIGQLVGGMAHEINNPLASVLVNMELLLSEAKEPSQLEILRAIKTETDRAAQVVRNLLTYVRGQGSVRSPIDLRDAVRGAVALRRSQLLKQGIQVEVQLPPEPVTVSGNTVNLQQVLMNLLVNAEHAVGSHRDSGHLWVRLTRAGGQAVVTIDDDGPGIAPELLSRIFDPFYTTRPEGEGAGLGLSVSAGIVADHRGRITAAERPGGGARFTVELSLLEGSQPPPPEEAACPAPAPVEGTSRRRILLVDDEPGIRRSISRFLTRAGWEVDLADSGEEGLRVLAGGDYAAVLCDLRMPGMGGHEFYRRLQEMDSPAVERLIFMTGDVHSPEVSRFLQEAARPVLSKPFTLQDLAQVLEQVTRG